MTDNRKCGVVKVYYPHRNFGFIRCNDGREFFFHANNFKQHPTDIDELMMGDNVEFYPDKTSKGPCAMDLVLIKKEGDTDE